MSQNTPKNDADVDLSSLQKEVDEEFNLNDKSIFGNNQESNAELALIEDYVTSDITKYPISTNPPKYKLIEPSILFEFWGHKVLDSYMKQTNKIIAAFKRKDLKVPSELEQQLSFLESKISTLESSIQNGQISEEKYKRSLINAINRELLELPCRSLTDFNEFEQNILYTLQELLIFFEDDPEDNDNSASPNEKDQQGINNKEDIFKLLEIPSEFFLTEEEKTQFWGSFVLTFYLRLVTLIETIFKTIDPNHLFPEEFQRNKDYCTIELKKIKSDTKNEKISPSDYLGLISEAVRREKSKKGALLPPQKHRVSILEKEQNQIKQYLEDEEEEEE